MKRPDIKWMIVYEVCDDGIERKAGPFLAGPELEYHKNDIGTFDRVKILRVESCSSLESEK